MCTEIFIGKHSKVRLKTWGDLNAALGGTAVPYEAHAGLHTTNPNCCLCSVDIEATADKYGFTITLDEGGEVIFEAAGA